MNAMCERSAGRVGALVVTIMLLLCVSTVLAPARAGASEAKPFKIKRFTLQTTEAVKTPLSRESFGFVNKPVAFTQAGGHPDALTNAIEFETEDVNTPNGMASVPTRDPKDIEVSLPPGLLGNPTAVPRCSLKQALSISNPCPADTQIGVSVLHLLGDLGGGESWMGPIVNVIPEAGQSAEFALENYVGIGVLLTAHVVRTSKGYGLTVVSKGTTDVQLTGTELTFWGVPAAKTNDPERGLFCEHFSFEAWNCGVSFSKLPNEGRGGETAGEAEVPFLTWPTDCSGGPGVAMLRADSWEEPGQVGVNGKYEGYAEAQTTLPDATGCNLLQFDPGVGVEPNLLRADEPVEVGVNLTVPQFEEPQKLATPELRTAVLTLPEGLSISPGIVDGIQACNESGPQGINFTGPESEVEGLSGELQLAPGHCPDASNVGEAEAVTPLLSEPVKGHVYLARPGCGGAAQAPCTAQDALDGNLYNLYLELGGEGPLADTGVNLKVRFKTEANPATGQLTTVAEENPQLPFSELRIRLNGGPRSPLDNPAACGAAVTTADLTPWSTPGTTPEGVFMDGTSDATPSSFYNVDLAGDGLGTPCPSLPLRPGFTAGMVTPQAGAYSDFTMNLSRQDREQYLKGIQVHTPPGLSGMLSSVPLCEEPLADSGHCPESSKIGTTRVASGAGSHPFEIEGNVYLTKSYDGAPFGLSIVTNAVAGPFNLGLVVVRAKIDVNPENSTLTITTDETGPYAIPQILDGVPLRLQRVTVDIDRPDFMFNPTNCGAQGQPGMQQVTVVVSGSQNATANVSSQFAVGGCKSLQFKPKFTVSTSAKTSRADGASLDAKVVYPATTPGTEANIKSVKVDLPKQMPSRLTTLQKACTAATFAANSADCPAPSVVGMARVSTPLLPVQLTGPVYFVSHGGEAFPSLVVVLQGDGVRVDVTAATFISKAGITSSTFKSVPDVPFNSFELYLPEGKYSALAANGNLCKSKLEMPTAFTAQNGAEIHQSTKITVTGCPKSTKAKSKHTKKPKKDAQQSAKGRTSK